jgi:hypothetical protein
MLLLHQSCSLDSSVLFLLCMLDSVLLLTVLQTLCLNKALTNVKLYLEVLSLIVEAINSTDYANITEKCVHQVTKLQFCSH